MAIAMNRFTQRLRHNEIRKIQSDLERDSFPRLQMFLLVTLTGATGFVASYLFLRAGLVEMWLRYLVSFGVAYLMFFALLWLWLRTRAGDYADIPDISGAPTFGSDGSSVGGKACYSGKGGGFDGGGASGSFDAPSDGILGIDDSGRSGGDALGSVADADDFAIPLVILVFIGAMVFSSLFMVYSAPVLFAELLVDGVLSASLYRRLRGLETRHWLETALRRTALPFAMTAIIVAASGWAMTLYAPGAHSIGGVISYSKRSS